MKKKIYLKFALAVLVILRVTGDVTAFTVTVKTMSPQALQAPSLDPYNYQTETTVFLTFHNYDAGASTELWRSRESESGYELIATVAPGVGEYYDRDLKPRTVFYYKARSTRDGMYSEYSSVVEYQTYSNWFNPTLSASMNATGDSIILQVTDNSYADAYYYFRRNGKDWDDRPFPDLSDSGRTVLIYDGDIQPNTTYTYEFIAHLLEDGAPSAEGGEVTITTPATTPNCADAGAIERERWNNISGTDVSTIPVGSPPDAIATLTSFMAPANEGTNYGARVRGYICVPITGAYTFWISSDDKSELWLSSDEDPDNKRKIASVTGHTNPLQWTKYPSQKSVSISLLGGRRYYIEAVHKEAFGGDHLAVGWQLPNGTMERPIPGNRLIKFERVNVAPIVSVTAPTDEQEFTAPATVTLSADASDANGGLLVVDFYHGTKRIGRVQSAPYTLTWPAVPAGTYTIEARAWDQDGGTSSDFVTFYVNGSCNNTGPVSREIWRNISGTSVSGIPVNNPPDNLETLSSLSTPNYYANNYGSRIRGYLCVPATGEYTFWISGDDAAELWLSTNDDPVNKEKIASVPRATRINEWHKYPTQYGTVQLSQGARYYFEVLHKEANGADHVEVAWQLPDGSQEMPIPGNRLIPYEDTSTSAAGFATSDVFNFEEETTFSVSPNPALSGRQVSLKIPVVTKGAVNVDIKSITGVSVQQETLSSDGEDVTFDLKPFIAAGMYLIRVSNGKGRWTTKLRVE